MEQRGLKLKERRKEAIHDYLKEEEEEEPRSEVRVRVGGRTVGLAVW